MCLTKKERFYNLVARGAAVEGELDLEVQRVKEVLLGHYGWLLYVFRLHAANDLLVTSAAYMGWLSYGSLVDQCGVVDPKTPGCRQTDMDTIFKAANYEVCSSLERLGRFDPRTPNVVSFLFDVPPLLFFVQAIHSLPNPALWLRGCAGLRAEAGGQDRGLECG